VSTRHFWPRSVAGADSVQSDGVPDEVVARAKAAFASRATGPLAALTCDSTLDGDEPVAVRRLRFASASLSVEAVVEGCAAWRTVRGRVEPERLSVQLELEGVATPLATGGSGGHFRFDGLPSGLMRLRLAGTDGSDPSHTEWFRV
jgi:hypothetical protein